MSVLTACLFTSLLITVAMANLQDWSELIYLDKPHTLSCNLTNGNRSVSTSDTLIWTKLGSEVALKSDEYYQLLNDSGISNIFLKIRIVTEEMSGIYFCTVTDMNYEYVGRMVKGVNIAGFLTDDKFDEYRTDVVRGVISAASVFVLVVGICVIDRFRYLSDEQKQTRRDRKQDRLRKLQNTQNGGIDNLAMQDVEQHNVDKRNGSSSSPFDGNTHL